MSKSLHKTPPLQSGAASAASIVPDWAIGAQQLRERLVYLCTDLAPTRGSYAYLEEQTGIGASKWKNLFLRRQMPTIEMLLAISYFRPHHAEWLLNGVAAKWD